jgi:2-hydroxy-3-keto-5-methylthiopentenyl-1-phosphate phosphatase
MTSAPTLIFCDFDGTITDHDITDFIWTDQLGPGWASEIFPPGSAAGRTMVERIGLGFSRVALSPARMLERIDGRIHVRSGFDDLVRVAADEHWVLRVLSCGLRFYIEKILPPGIPCDCFIGTFDGTWHVALPDDVVLAPGEDYKLHVLEQRSRSLPGARRVYIGDGPSDFEPARHCDRAFAVQGSKLARLCQDAGVACTEFTRFDEVIRDLVA